MSGHKPTFDIPEAQLARYEEFMTDYRSACASFVESVDSLTSEPIASFKPTALDTTGEWDGGMLVTGPSMPGAAIHKRMPDGSIIEITGDWGPGYGQFYTVSIEGRFRNLEDAKAFAEKAGAKS